MKKHRLSVDLDPNMMAELTKVARRKEQPTSLVAEAAITSFVTSDHGDRREAAFACQLDLLIRQAERLERDLATAVETLCLSVALPLPDDAQARGRERSELLREALSRRLANGNSELRGASTDWLSQGFWRQP